MASTRRLLLLIPFIAVGCVDLDTPFDDGWVPEAHQRDTMEATVSFGTDATFPFFADDVVASLTNVNGQEELVISGLSADRTRSLALVLDLRSVAEGEVIDMSQHGAVYMEMGLGDADFIFDGTPQGELYLQGELEPGSDLSARFDFFISTYDRDGEATADLGVGLDGSVSVRLLEAE